MTEPWGKARSCLLAAAMLASCGRSISPTVSTSPAVKLVLNPDPSGRCCDISTVNPGPETVRVACELYVFDRSGRLVFVGLIPGPPPGERRSPARGGMGGGFTVQPGRRSHGWTEIPLGPDGGSYRATCRAAAWHGAPPL